MGANLPSSLGAKRSFLEIEYLGTPLLGSFVKGCKLYLASGLPAEAVFKNSALRYSLPILDPEIF